MVNRRLVDYLESGNFLDQRQFAFRAGMGTNLYLASLGEILTDARSEGLHVDIGVLDLAKAYNTVWRGEVLRILHSWGVRGNLGVFLQEFLRDRSAHVAIGGTISSPYTEENGVPQGFTYPLLYFL